MKVASWRSRMRRSDLWTYKLRLLVISLTQAHDFGKARTSVGSASPMMILRIEM